MTPNQIADGLTAVETDNTYFAVQGLRNNTWTTLFAPYWSATDAMVMRDHLAEKNPAARYQAIRIETIAQ